MEALAINLRPRRWSVLGLCLVLLVAGCVGPDLTLKAPSSMDSEVTYIEGVTSWVVTTRGEGPRWIGPDWWRTLGVEEHQLGHDHVRMELGNEQVPTLWIDGPQGRGMLFYARPITGSLQTYALTLQAQGVRMDHWPSATSDKTDSTSCQTTTPATVSMASNEVYRSTAPLDEPWLWKSLRPPQEFSVTVPLTDRVKAPVTMTLQIWGQSRMPVDPDHHLRVSWNGEILDDHFWDGDDVETWSLTLPQSTNVDNTLTLIAPGETEAPVDMMWLDAMTFQWHRRLVFDDRIWTSWTVTSSSHACVEGDVGDDAVILLTNEKDPHVYQGEYQAIDGESGRIQVYQQAAIRGWMGVPWSAPEPIGIRPWAGMDIDGSAIRDAEFIVLADAAVKETLQPLLDAREAEGLASLHLTPEAIYDSFGRGVPDVSAIRAMILHLHRHGRLRYVLLIGDATSALDAQPFGRAGTLWIPTGWSRTAYVGQTASDSLIATGDQGEPVVALGRIPVTTQQDLHTVIQKTLSWQPNSRVMLVNDDEVEFVNLVDQLAEISPPDIRVGTDEPDARQTVMNWLDAGPGIMVYSGHGSLPVLGDEKLLTWEDADAWEGPTVVVAWSCLCASFAHPQHQSLAETWMLGREGTVAFVGPTGETTTGEQRTMALVFQRALVDEPRLGDAMLQAWHAAQSDNVKTGFVLLGDPTLETMHDSQRAK